MTECARSALLRYLLIYFAGAIVPLALSFAIRTQILRADAADAHSETTRESAAVALPNHI